MRKNIVVANWKMNLNIIDGISLIEAILKRLSLKKKIEVVFAPSFVHLYKVAEMCADVNFVSTSSQDCSSREKGAFTGDVSAAMVVSSGARYVILGHSERRSNLNETNEILREKVGQALLNGLQVIFCCGESLDQREGRVHFEWIRSQISESLFHLSAEEFDKIVIAYEPIWAIGTGVTTSSNQAQEVHSFIRTIIKDKYGGVVAQNTSILYGGSCNPSNAVELFSQQDIDGGLIGGASLKADDFIAITNSF